MNGLQRYRSHLHLHFIVLIYGFTGILANLISVSSAAMVWYRMLIAFVGLGLFMLLARKPVLKDGRSWVQLLAIGFVIAVHWALFFEAIKVSNISVTLACLAATPLFIALLEPLFFNRRIIAYEVFFGVLVIIGLYLIFQFETRYRLGIIYSLLSAFFAALFTVLNASMIRRHTASNITLVEMLGGVVAISIYLAVSGQFSLAAFTLTGLDWLWLGLLGLVCTSYAFVVSVEVMKDLSPFTVGISVNLEPIYSILLALWIFGESEFMSGGFYLGAFIILGTVIGNAILKSRTRKASAQPTQEE